MADKTASAVPSDEAIAKARADKARAENLAKGREAKAEKREQAPTAPLSKEVLEAGCRSFVRALWALSGFVAFIVGGSLLPLTEADIDAGAAEALPLVRRFRLLSVLLSFIGFPVWLFRQVAEKFAAKSKPEKGAAATGPSPAPPRLVSGGPQP